MRGRGDEGQAAVELALVLPLVMVAFLAVVQVGLVVRDQVLVVHAAREAARQAAVDGDPGAVRRAALAGSGLSPAGLEVTMGPRGEPGGRVRVEVRYRSPTDVPLVGAAVSPAVLRAAASMRVED